MAFLTTLAALVVPGTATGEVVVKPEFPDYAATATEPLPVRIVFDHNSITPALEPHPDGLKSFGIQLQFNTTRAELVSIQVAPELDFVLNDPGARIEIDPDNGRARVFGNVRIPGGTAMRGTVLLTAVFDAVTADFELEVDRYQPGSPVTDFSDGNGQSIDELITFESARIHLDRNVDSILRIARAGGNGGGSAGVELRFDVDPTFDYTVQSTTVIRPGTDSIWIDLPGAPHNTGLISIQTSGRESRFFRIKREAASVVPAPVLAVSRENGVLRIEFETIPGWDYVLESSNRVAPTALWSALPGAPHNSGMVEVAPAAGPRFFRLTVTRP